MRKPKHLKIILLLAVAAPCLGQAAQTLDPQRQTALTLEQEGKTAEAEGAWRAVLKTHPSNPEPYAHLGLLEARQEHYKEAVSYYRKAMSLGPAVPALHLNLGLALFKEGELKPAIIEFKPLLKRAPTASPQAQQLTILLGMAHYGLGEYAEAAPYLKTATANDAQNLQLRLALAHSYLWSKQYQKVLDVYHEILVLAPDSAEADMLAGEAQDELKDHAGAIEQFRAAVKANPKQPEAHFGLGYLLWGARQYPEAVKEFQAELANNPDHIQAMAYQADAEMQMSQPDVAIPLMEKVEKRAPKLVLAHLDLGILYTDAGRQDDALRELTEAARLTPQDVDVHWRLARLYRAMGKKDEAIAEFAKAKGITRAADNAVFDKMGGAPAKPASK